MSAVRRAGPCVRERSGISVISKGCCTANNRCGLITTSTNANTTTCTNRNRVQVNGVALTTRACDAAATDAAVPPGDAG